MLIDLGKAQRLTHAAALRKVAEVIRRGDALYTTRLNVAELWVGIERAANRAAELAQVTTVLQSVVVLELEAASAEQYGKVQRHLFGLGLPIGDMDALIAAVCVVNRQNLVTRNPKHFANIPGLVVETY